VLDYQRVDFTQNAGAYDVIFDAAAKSSFSRCREALKPNGVYLTTVPSPGMWLRAVGRKDGKALKMPATAMRSKRAKTKDLELLANLAEAGRIRAITDRRFPLEQAQEAHRYVESGQKSGDVVFELAAS
jgi:NADPH:quinone reductase-like Zn-dependent oxidoreductase